MDQFTTPRTGASVLSAFFRARAIERMRGRADNAAALLRDLERERARRDRPAQAAAPSPAFWILHAR